MSTLALASAGTSPGVTTTALSLAMAWSRPVMLVEADVSKPSSVVAGLLQGSLPADAGLMGVAQASGIEPVTEQDIWDFCVPLPQEGEELGRWLLPALSEPAAARHMRAFWSDLLRVLRALDTHPVDAVVDLGRVEDRHGRHDLLTDTDHLALVVRSDLGSVAAARTYLPDLEADRASRGASETISVIVVEDLAQRISSSQIAKFLGVPVSGRIPHAAQAAAALSGGARVSSRTRRPLEAAARATTASLVQQIDKRRAVMEGPIA
ncbi:hypothetical protein [Micrococcus luteus]|uniref:hypothetical protein n=1 Tax=Micrococcus luteus TaxID=1270 RepID=UPI0023045784|nr:hypothetical protein [Micrococcus luteus]